MTCAEIQIQRQVSSEVDSSVPAAFLLSIVIRQHTVQVKSFCMYNVNHNNVIVLIEILEKPDRVLYFYTVVSRKKSLHMHEKEASSSANAKRTARPLQKYYRGTPNVWELP